MVSQQENMVSNSRFLNDLLESSRNLPSSSSELGSIMLSINEINKKAQDGKPTTTQDNFTKAHYLLAGSGVPIDAVEMKIKSLGAASKALVPQSEKLKQVRRGDLDSYLRYKKDENILSSIEQSLSTASKDFDNFVNHNFNLDWKRRRDEIRDSLLSREDGSQTLSSAPATKKKKLLTWGSTSASIIDGESKLNVNENHAVREKFERYARIVHKFNNSRQENKEYPLAEEFVEVFKNSTDSKLRQLYESWKIVQNNRGEKNVVAKSRTYLESQFMEYIDALYKKNPTEGLPTNINKMKAFIDAKLKNSATSTWKVENLTIINGTPIWALIFYLLRAGLVHEALEVAVNNKQSLKKVEHSFLNYFKAYVSADRLSQEATNRLHTEYNQYIKSSVDGDPYRQAVYKIIGRCDLARKNIAHVDLSIEDWVWVHCMLVKDGAEDPIYERYTLKDFQSLITSLGAAKFSNYYLQVLLLAGLYEEAIAYAVESNEIEGLHLSIALAHYNLLSDGDKFSKSVGAYTKSFKFSDPRIAVEYLILIPLVKEQASVAHQALRDLVLETREFTILLGKVGRDGTRIPGVIEERQSLLGLSDEKDFLFKITEQSARKADEEGRIYDALLLFQLSEEYDIVITIVNKLLGELLSNTELDQPLLNADDNNETNPVLIAKKLLGVYLSNLQIASQISNKAKETCSMLLQLVDVRTSFSAGQWDRVLKLVEELDLIPFTNEQSARQKAQDFNNLNENIVKNIPNLLVLTMTSLSNLAKQLSLSEFTSAVKQERVHMLKRVARNCMVYAGLIQYKMPHETYSILIKLEVGM